MATKSDKFINQVTSGRWILSIIAGIAFFVFSITVSYVIIKTFDAFKPETLIAMFSSLLLVIQSVYKDYFAKLDRSNGNADTNGDSTTTTTTLKP